jgi:hypothetical protein
VWRRRRAGCIGRLPILQAAITHLRPALRPSLLIKGTLIVADPAAGSTGPQLLYQAIGAGNLVAWTGARETGGTDGVSN